MNAGFGGPANRPLGVPGWFVWLFVCVGLLFIGLVFFAGYVLLDRARWEAKEERIHRVLNENYRRYNLDHDISPQKPFEESDALSSVGNHLHEMIRLFQIEFKSFRAKCDGLDWRIDTKFASISNPSAFQRASREIEKLADAYGHFADAKARILDEYTGLIRQAARGNAAAREIADHYLEYERSDLDFWKAYSQTFRKASDAKRKRLNFVWSNRKWFALGADGQWVLIASAPATVQKELETIESEVSDLLERLEEIYDSWGE